jgi:hypothetical protein
MSPALAACSHDKMVTTVLRAAARPLWRPAAAASRRGFSGCPAVQSTARICAFQLIGPAPGDTARASPDMTCLRP